MKPKHFISLCRPRLASCHSKEGYFGESWNHRNLPLLPYFKIPDIRVHWTGEDAQWRGSRCEH